MSTEDKKPDEADEAQNDSSEPTPLCPECLTPVDPKRYYCPKCGSDAAINPAATYMPFVRIPFEVGNMVKAMRLYPAWALLFIAIAFPLVAILGLPLIVTAFARNRSLRTPFNYILTAIIIILILASIALRFHVRKIS